MAQSTALRVVEVAGALVGAGALVFLLINVRRLRADVNVVDTKLDTFQRSWGRHVTSQGLHVVAMRRHRDAVEPPGAGI